MNGFSPSSTLDRDDRSFARRRMVDTQVRPVGVGDPRLLDLMRALPRDRFVPADQADLAYRDDDVPLGNGRVLMEPRVIARLLQVAVPRRGEAALVVGAGTGYAACLLRRLGLRVVAVEEDAALAAIGRELGEELAAGVDWRTAPLHGGAPADAPFDVILLDGAVASPPHHLAPQLAPGGRLVGVLMPSPRMGQAFIAEASPVGLAMRPEFDATTALLPGFGAAPVFRF